MQNWYSHLRRYTTSYALGIIYGKRGPTLSSPDVVDFMDVHPKFINALEIGTMPPVDLFPILTLVPERWANWKKIVRNIRHLHETLYDRLLSTVEKRMADGNGTGVFLEQMITKAQQYGLTTRDHILWVCFRQMIDIYAHTFSGIPVVSCLRVPIHAPQACRTLFTALSISRTS